MTAGRTLPADPKARLFTRARSSAFTPHAGAGCGPDVGLLLMVAPPLWDFSAGARSRYSEFHVAEAGGYRAAARANRAGQPQSQSSSGMVLRFLASLLLMALRSLCYIHCFSRESLTGFLPACSCPSCHRVPKPL